MGKGPADTRPLIHELLDTDLPSLERNLREKQKDLDATPADLLKVRDTHALSPATLAIVAGEQKYTDIPVATFAIYAVPHDLGPALGKDPAERAAYEARVAVTTEAQARAFEIGVPSARWFDCRTPITTFSLRMKRMCSVR